MRMENINITHIINNFNHLLFNHHSKHDRNYISIVLETCNKNKIKCDIALRHYRDRETRFNSLNFTINTNMLILNDILDKIHFYYVHANEPNNSNFVMRKKFNQMKQQNDSLNIYSFGEVYYYWKWYKNKNEIDILNHGLKYSEGYVEPKYKSLKDELLNNGIYKISKHSW